MTMRATAFGLDVESQIPLSLLERATAAPTGRALALSLAEAGAAEPPWPDSATLVCDERQPDGNSIYQIQAHPAAGYLISGPKHGAHRLSADGRLLCCDSQGLPDADWQRLLIAQVLPFAALLRGLEVFHASAVVWRAHAVAFLGPSRAGKTSLALELCGRGAGFLADDVIALEPRHEQLLAHPGTPLASVVAGELGDAGERLVRVAGASEPVALGALFFLDRRADGPERPRFEPAADALALLSATFNFVLATPERLRSLLEVCALAARLRVERIVCGPDTSVAELGAAVELRLTSSTPYRL
jgi:hypothetical protein